MSFKSRIVLLFLFFGVVFSGCQKHDDVKKETRRDHILGTWTRVLRAYDHNRNHVIDPAEIVIAPATDTFFFGLAPDATYRRIQTYKGENFQFKGTWRLQHGDTDIVLYPTTSTSKVDTFRFDTVSSVYMRYHTISEANVWYWEAFQRPR